jgi:hypothetical protein
VLPDASRYVLEVSILRYPSACGSASVSAHGPEAIDDYSKSRRPRTAVIRGLGGLGALAAGLGVAGAALAVVATFSTIIEIRSITVTLASFSGWDRSGPALLLLAAFALVMVAGAVRGARPAMAGLAAAGVAVLLVAILVDQPHLNDESVWERARDFEAEATAGKGWLFETAAGVLMLLGGVLMLLLAPGRQAERPARAAAAIAPEPGTVAPPSPTPTPAPAARAEGSADWFADSPVESRAQRLTQPQPPRRRGGLLGRMRGRD